MLASGQGAIVARAYAVSASVDTHSIGFPMVGPFLESDLDHSEGGGAVVVSQVNGARH